MSKNYYDKNIISLHDFHFFKRKRNFNIVKFHTMFFFLLLQLTDYDDQENVDLEYKKVQ